MKVNRPITAAIARHAAISNAHHTPAAPGLTVPIFQENPATGNFPYQPEAINNNLTGNYGHATAIDQYAEVNFGKNVTIYWWRQYGHAGNNQTGRWKIQYYNGAWIDWAINIPTALAAWTAPAGVSVAGCSRIRIVCTTVDTAVGQSKIGELEVFWG